MPKILNITLKAYGINLTVTGSSMIQHFDNATYFKEIDLNIPVMVGNDRTGTARYLYNYDSVTAKSIIDQSTIEYLDSITPFWQLATIFYMGYDQFDASSIPKAQAIKLFPNRYNFAKFPYNTIFLTNDELNVVFALRMVYSGAAVSSSTVTFLKGTTTTINGSPLSIIHFNKGGGGSYASDYYINSRLVLYDEQQDQYGQFNTIGSWPSGTSNEWYFCYYDGTSEDPTYKEIGSSNIIEKAEEITTPTYDPYKQGGESETGGGNGDFDRDSGSVPIPDLPTLSAADTGFITLFNPTTAQLKNLAEYMWSGGFDVDTFKKIVADPMECILGLSIVPVNIPSGGSAEVKIGNIGTGVNMTKASSQYVVKDCGSLNLKEYWGSYLDYSPYTKVTSLYLPYVGVVSVDSDIIMNKTLGVKYHIDVLSGQCIAYITVNGNVNFQYQGSCSVSIPVTSVDYSSMISAGMNIVSSIAGIGAAGAAGGMMMGGPAGAAIGAATAAISAIPSVANNVMQSKPDIKSGGSVGGMGGMMGVQYPFLIIEWPRQSVPAKQNAFTGYPSNIRARLGSLSGYTECDMVIMDKVSATDAERAEIENLLKGGVYL